MTGSEPAQTGPDSYGFALQEAVDTLQAGREAVAGVVVRLLSSDGSLAALWDFDSAARELVCRHTSLADLIDRRIPLGVGVAGWVASHRRPATVVDRRTDRRGDHYAGDLRVPTAGAAVPVPGGEHYTGGVLEVYGAGAGQRSVTSADLIGLGRLAAVIAACTRDPVVGPARADSTPSDSITDIEGQNKHMAAELHDGVSQRLASLSFHLAAATAALAEPPPEPTSDAAGQRPGGRPLLETPLETLLETSSDPVHFALQQLIVAAELTQLAADDVRAAISGLRPPVLDDLGLARGLASLCGALGSGDLAVEVDVEDVEPPLVSPAASLALYRVAQEALGNAMKHAGVASVRVRLQRRGANVVLDVRDDGVGYRQTPDGTTTPPPTTATTRGQHTGSEGGLGLRSMAERMAAVGGHIELWSAPGRGTQVRAIVRDEDARAR